MTDLDLDRAVLLLGDCRERLRALPANSIDACVTDPPYELTAATRSKPPPEGAGPFARHRVGVNGDHRPVGGFMGKEWDGTGVSFDPATWAEVLRVLKPGAHALVFGGTRTSHRLTVAIEDAGFEIRDCLAWMYGTGFPKSLNISKAIDAAGGRGWGGIAAELRIAISRAGLNAQQIVERLGWPSAASVNDYIHGGHVPPPERQRQLEALLAGFRASPDRPVVGVSSNGIAGGTGEHAGDGSAYGFAKDYALTVAATPEAAAWDGWGTALKPAHEPIVLARKPLEGTVAANVARWGTGGLNIDACRIATSERLQQGRTGLGSVKFFGGEPREIEKKQHDGGRWPANVLLDEEAAAELDAQSGILKSGVATKTYEPTLESSVALGAKRRNLHPGATIGDSGGASRFFYVAKASRSERDLYCAELPQRTGGEATDRVDGSIGVDNPRAGAGRTGGARNFHPTVKPITLLRYLIRLVTPPGGIVLDAFAGSGSTAIAALLEGRRFVGIEREPEYFEIAAARTRGAHERPEEAA